jgi:threonylcarbamoyladenosine tRNA methylthiotransferase MtaB
MKTFSINTLGCKVNQYESQQIRELLERFGLSQAETADRSDLVVINTCCITHTASAKSRRHIQKAQRLNPNAVIVVSGCLPSVQIGELKNPGKNVHLVRHRDDIAISLSQIINGKAAVSNSQSVRSCRDIIIKSEDIDKIKPKNKLANQLRLPLLTSFKGHTRAFLKIQDGCDGYCSYCIIPKIRPIVHSKPAETVLQEAQALVEASHKEIVLTGIFLGAYGQNSVRRKNWDNRRNDKLADLLEKLAEIPNLARIRLSSLEPAGVTPRLLDAFCKCRNIMPHLHLSLQSGSNAILKKMCRQYEAEGFMETVESVKSRLDRPAITTDIIVGFPGETDAEFQETVEMAKKVGFAKMHVFSFSARKGTAAAGLQGSVNNRVIKERAQILRELDIELGHKFRQQFMGETTEIIVENDDGRVGGRSERYFMVYLEKASKKPEKNELVRVKLTENVDGGVMGRAIETQAGK